MNTKPNVVAYEFFNETTGHAIVDYTENTHAGQFTARNGYIARPLVYADEAMVVSLLALDAKAVEALMTAIGAKAVAKPSEVEKFMDAAGLCRRCAAPVADAPIDMVLHCPACGMQHVDAPDERTPGWVNESHRSHLCHGCGHIWRPADVPTNGVAAIKTKGKADSPVAQPVQAQPSEHVPEVHFGKTMKPETLRVELQKMCSAWGSYWRASDAHGVELTTEQAVELLQNALNVEVEIKDEESVTQAKPEQAAQPLTPAERRALIDAAGDVTDGLNQDDFADEIVLAVERHHGIAAPQPKD